MNYLCHCLNFVANHSIESQPPLASAPTPALKPMGALFGGGMGGGGLSFLDAIKARKKD